MTSAFVSKIINFCDDQCYEIVKDTMGVLDRKAGLDWEEQGKFSRAMTYFWEDKNKMNRPWGKRGYVLDLKGT